MKKASRLLAALVVASLLVPSAFAAKGNRKKQPDDPVLTKYDANKNGKIDADEADTLKKAFEADPKGELAKLDTNHDGKLSDEEIAAIGTPPPKKKKKGTQ
ncbi:MAG: hypothetical protein RLZZ15_528 [Verrucomicrobiota bacterium]|jgi:hypothetical protein